MNFRTTLLLLCLLIIAAAAVVYLQQPAADPPHSAAERAAGQGELVFSHSPAFSVDRITHLTVAYPSGRSTTAALRDGSWWQTSPARFELVPSHVRGVLEAAVNLRWIERFTPTPTAADTPPDGPDAPDTDAFPSLEQISLEQIHLDPPRAVLSLTYTDHAGTDDADTDRAGTETGTEVDTPRTHVIRLGRTLGGRAYVLVDDDPRVHVVGADLVNRLLPETLATPLLSDWRIRTLDGPDPYPYSITFFTNSISNPFVTR
jgi:hypothetical protein